MENPPCHAVSRPLSPYPGRAEPGRAADPVQSADAARPWLSDRVLAGSPKKPRFLVHNAYVLTWPGTLSF